MKECNESVFGRQFVQACYEAQLSSRDSALYCNVHDTKQASNESDSCLLASVVQACYVVQFGS